MNIAHSFSSQMFIINNEKINIIFNQTVINASKSCNYLLTNNLTMDKINLYLLQSFSFK